MISAAVAIPRSSPRAARGCFTKLLYSVDPDATHGFGFHGTLLRPGARLTVEALRPTPEYPEIPLLLEYGSVPVPGDRLWAQLYILWRFEVQTHSWRELARTTATAWEWAYELRPIAVRALARVAISTPLDHAAIAGRLSVLLDVELGALAPADRVRVLSVLHDELAGRVCA